MAARPGLADLILRLRRMLADTGSPPVWSDDELQELLDQNRLDFFGEPLTAIVRDVSGGSEHTLYQSAYGNLEEFTSGDTSIFRLYDSAGVSPVITTDYTADFQTGRIVFVTDQGGLTYYLDGRSYDLYGAAADGWLEFQGTKAATGITKFSEDGQSFDFSTRVSQAQSMVDYYNRRRRRRPAQAIRA
jgi:hypothetical protein